MGVNDGADCILGHATQQLGGDDLALLCGEDGLGHLHLPAALLRPLLHVHLGLVLRLC